MLRAKILVSVLWRRLKRLRRLEIWKWWAEHWLHVHLVFTPIGSLVLTYLLTGASIWRTEDDIKTAAVVAPLGILICTASAAMLEGLITAMVLAYRVNEKLKADFKAEQERRENERKERIESLKQEGIQEFIRAATGEISEEALERIMERLRESQRS